MEGRARRETDRALVALAFAGGASLNLGYVQEIRDAAGAMPGWEAAGRIGLGALLALLTAGLPEEVVYRGILQTRLECVLGRIRGLLLTAVLFIAWHLPTRRSSRRTGRWISCRAWPICSAFVLTERRRAKGRRDPRG